MGELVRKHSRSSGGGHVTAALGFERLSPLSYCHVSQTFVELVYALEVLIKADVALQLCTPDIFVMSNEALCYRSSLVDIRVDIGHNFSPYSPWVNDIMWRRGSSHLEK